MRQDVRNVKSFGLGQGIGSKTLGALEQEARRLGSKGIFLNASPTDSENRAKDLPK